MGASSRFLAFVGLPLAGRPSQKLAPVRNRHADKRQPCMEQENPSLPRNGDVAPIGRNGAEIFPCS